MLDSWQTVVSCGGGPTVGTQDAQLGAGAWGCRYGCYPSLGGSQCGVTCGPPSHGHKATKSSRKTVRYHCRHICVKDKPCCRAAGGDEHERPREAVSFPLITRAGSLGGREWTVDFGNHSPDEIEMAEHTEPVQGRGMRPAMLLGFITNAVYTIH